MITAHLPSGYIVGRLAPPPLPAYGMMAALLGSVLPDVDLLFFYFIDDRAIHHHCYWVHIPAFWLGVGSVLLPLAAWEGHLRLAVIFCVAIAVHLVLDSIGGGILWAAPFNDQLYALVQVPATRSHWILSYLLHWTILFEVTIWIMAMWLWFGRKTR